MMQLTFYTSYHVLIVNVAHCGPCPALREANTSFITASVPTFVRKEASTGNQRSAP